MAKKKVQETAPTPEDAEEMTAPELVEEGLSELEPEEPEEVELSNIPIEQFLKDPKMAEITEESEVEEVTAWCPVCNEYTIFVDKTCTVCGFVKGSKKAPEKEEQEESTESTFDLIPNEEVIDEMNSFGSGYDEEDGREEY